MASPEYLGFRREVALLSASQDCWLENNATVVVLGVGNGVKINELIKGAAVARVILVDISLALLHIARQNISFPTEIIQSDFESLDFSRFPKNSTFVILGGTLGNLINWKRFLAQLRMSAPRCQILLGMELRHNFSQDNISDIIKEYDNDDGFNFVFQPLRVCGLERRDGEIKVNFNPKFNRIEEWFRPKSDGLIKLVNLGVPEGKEVLLSVSHKLTHEVFLANLREIGWRIGLVRNCGDHTVIKAA